MALILLKQLILFTESVKIQKWQPWQVLLDWSRHKTHHAKLHSISPSKKDRDLKTLIAKKSTTKFQTTKRVRGNSVEKNAGVFPKCIRVTGCHWQYHFTVCYRDRTSGINQAWSASLQGSVGTGLNSQSLNWEWIWSLFLMAVTYVHISNSINY